MPGIDKSIFGLLSMNQLRWYWYDYDDDDGNDVDENDGVNVHDDYNHDNNYDVQYVIEMMMWWQHTILRNLAKILYVYPGNMKWWNLGS